MSFRNRIYGDIRRLRREEALVQKEIDDAPRCEDAWIAAVIASFRKSDADFAFQAGHIVARTDLTYPQVCSALGELRSYGLVYIDHTKDLWRVAPVLVAEDGARP